MAGKNNNNKTQPDTCKNESQLMDMTEKTNKTILNKGKISSDLTINYI